MLHLQSFTCPTTALSAQVQSAQGIARELFREQEATERALLCPKSPGAQRAIFGITRLTAPFPGDLQEEGKGRTEMDTTSHSPPKSESGESNSLDIPIVSTTNAHSSSPPGGKSSSWQRAGILKRTRAKPRARVSDWPPATLKGLQDLAQHAASLGPCTSLPFLWPSDLYRDLKEGGACNLVGRH